MAVSKIKIVETGTIANAVEQWLDDHVEDLGNSLTYYGVCSTAAGTAQKEVTISGITELTAGLAIRVKFDNENTIANPTLKVNTLPAAAIYRSATVAGSSSSLSWLSGSIVTLTYDGSNWVINNYNNTTYSSMTVSEAQNGTGTGGRVITPARLKMAIQYHGIAQPETAGTAGQMLSLDSNLDPVWTTIDLSAKADKANTVLDNTLSMGRTSSSTVGNKSTALGSSIVASGYYSFGEGYGTKATGQASHAGGELSEASGADSFAYGMGVIASGDSETVVGSYNKAGTTIPEWVAGTSYKVNDVVSRNGNSYRCIRANSSQSFDSQLDWKMSPFTTMEAFVVGNGGGTSSKSNAFEVRWDGTIKARRIILESPNGTPYMLSVADDGTLSITQVT